MRIVVISDTHALHFRVENLPDGDVLVHAGDFMNSGYDPRDILSFDYWLGEQPFKHRVVCAGNHDRYFQNFSRDARFLLTNATYLENTGVTIDNVTFWGSPYTPEFLNWAFMYPRGSGAMYWDQIPHGLDVLITHGPPFGILDQVAPGGEHLGCAELLESVEQKKPRVHLFGHIHGGAGTFESGATRFVNAAYLNEQYKPLKPAGNLNPFEQSKIIICSFQFARAKEPYLRQTAWDLVVIDEAHRLRNVYKPANKIGKAIKVALANRHKVLLTATPLQNSLEELYGLVSIVDEFTFGDLRSFKAQFGRLRSAQPVSKTEVEELLNDFTSLGTRTLNEKLKAHDAWFSKEYGALKARLKPICQRTLRQQVLQYVSYTKRHALVQECRLDLVGIEGNLGVRERSRQLLDAVGSGAFGQLMRKELGVVWR